MSLADTLISIFIFTLIITSVFGIFITYKNIYTIQVSYNELSANSTIAMENISSNIRGSMHVIESKNINGTDYSTDYDTLILELASIDNDQNIIADTYDYFVYFRDPSDNTLLKYDIEPNASSSRDAGIKLEAEYLKTLVFNYNSISFSSINKVETILVTEQNISDKTQNIVMQTTTDLRNN